MNQLIQKFQDLIELFNELDLESGLVFDIGTRHDRTRFREGL